MIRAHRRIAQGQQLLLDGQRQEQKSAKGGPHEVVAHRQARGGKARSQVMIHTVFLLGAGLGEASGGVREALSFE